MARFAHTKVRVRRLNATIFFATQSKLLRRNLRAVEQEEEEAQLSPRDRAMRRVNWNLANCHATVQKLLIIIIIIIIRLLRIKAAHNTLQYIKRSSSNKREDNKNKYNYERDKYIRQVLTKSTINRDATESLSLSQMCHKQTDDGRIVYITCISTTCCGKIF